MYAVTVTFEVDPEQITAFMPLMLENAQVSRDSEPGCAVFDVCRQGETVFLYELYDDRAAFDTHLNSSHFKAFDAAVREMIVSKQVATFETVIR